MRAYLPWGYHTVNTIVMLQTQRRKMLSCVLVSHLRLRHSAEMYTLLIEGIQQPQKVTLIAHP
jgi:hypothetical protein